MRLIFKHEHEGVFFSHNGHRAFLRGEKPGFMFQKENKLVPVCVHHIARPYGENKYTRELVMFYRKDSRK
jgi:hypothetical protein